MLRSDFQRELLEKLNYFTLSGFVAETYSSLSNFKNGLTNVFWRIFFIKI